MADLAEKLEGIREKLASKAEKFMPDVCNLVVGASVPDGYGGSTDTESTLESNVPCKYEALSYPRQQQIGGGAATTLTHKITMPSTAVTKIIRPHYKIVVAAQNDQPELTFENPVTLDGSFSVFVKVAAELAE